MRRAFADQGGLFSYISPEARSSIALAIATARMT
jgi:hypothetical protein